MRSILNPLGVAFDFVLDANLTISRPSLDSCILTIYVCMHTIPYIVRCVLILILAESMHLVWVLEQPHGSSDVLWLHPRMSWFSNEIGFALASMYDMVAAYHNISFCLRSFVKTSGCSTMGAHVQSGPAVGEMTPGSFKSLPGSRKLPAVFM